jgi:hypothetical protein
MNLIICFTHERLYRSFEELNYIGNIKRIYPELEIVLTYGKSIPEINANSYKFNITKSNAFMNRFRKFVLDFFTFKYMDSSVSFQTKIRHQVGLSINRKISLITFVLIGNLRWSFISILCSRYFYKLCSLVLRKLADINMSVNFLLRKVDSGVLLIVSGGPFSNIENILLNYARKYNVPSALIIDNWDNLSSKSILWHEPKLLGVWGPNMSRDAQVIHKIPPKSIINIGSSRIFKPIPDQIQSNVPFILFAGSGNHLETEIELVKLAAALLDKYDLFLLYRPHPYRHIDNNMIEELRKITNLSIDPSWFKHEKSNFYSFDSLNSLLNQCKFAAFVISGHSTVLVEALYLGKYVISYSGTNSPFFENGDLWQGYHHLQELSNNPNIDHCVSISDFSKILEIASEKVRKNQLPLSTENTIQDIIPNFSDTYQERLINFIRLLSSSSA